jgi:folate-binding protein YgfZ
MPASTAYHAIEQGAAWCDRSGRVRLDVAGPDRAKFLHNLTTNEVKRLPVGRGCECFVTSPQGKTIGFATLLACPDSILLRTDPGGLVLALPHFQKYGVFDDVALEDRSDSTFEFHVVGPRGDELIRGVAGIVPEPAELAHVTASLGETPVLIVREAPTGRPGLTLIGPRGAGGRVVELLKSHAPELPIAELDPDTFEVLRIEAGTPVFGREVTEKSLPQELDRDARAINYVKGCYLGQETVARIDALGHVNQVLRGLRFEPDAVDPGQGAEVEADGKRVGLVTSSAYSPGWGEVIALAMLRTSHARPGTRVAVKGADGQTSAATVCTLPMMPPSRTMPGRPS